MTFGLKHDQYGKIAGLNSLILLNTLGFTAELIIQCKNKYVKGLADKSYQNPNQKRSEERIFSDKLYK